MLARFLLALALAASAAQAAAVPNIVIILCDDMGYADIGPFGSNVPTPNLDRVAREGTKFTDFYVGQPICSASRAALMTGCYPNRVSILGALSPSATYGLGKEEKTLAEVLRPQGYTSAIVGKWHLGSQTEFLPTHRGFSEYFGLPYSNDMWPLHPDKANKFPPLPLFEGDQVIEYMPDQTQLTTRYTERAVRFIEQNHGHPFFLYLAHNMPHVPLHVSDKFKGKSPRGLFGDVVMEIDWSVGEVLTALKRTGVDENTLLVFASDNGPWLLYGNHAGHAEPLREGKATTFDGGARVPCLMRWPGHIPAGRACSEPLATFDLLPTIAKLAGAPLPERRIDGLDIWPVVSGQEGAKSPHEVLYFYWGPWLHAVRSGPWKMHFPHLYPHPDPAGADGLPGHYTDAKIELSLFNLETDPGETQDVSASHPEVVQRLNALAETARLDLGDGKPGPGVRPRAEGSKSPTPNKS